MIQVYVGTGKGKTTASVGQAIRAVGAGMKVAFVQFLKPGTSSELNVMRNVEGLEVYYVNGSDRFLWEMQNLEGVKKEVKQGMKLVEDLLSEGSEGIDMLILDEVLHLVGNELLNEERLVELVKNAKPDIVLTGLWAGKRIKEVADIVTDMRKVKHCYDKGEKARKGIEF